MEAYMAKFTQNDIDIVKDEAKAPDAPKGQRTLARYLKYHLSFTLQYRTYASVYGLVRRLGLGKSTPAN
jgi:hypothetical protein